MQEPHVSPEPKPSAGPPPIAQPSGSATIQPLLDTSDVPGREPLVQPIVATTVREQPPVRWREIGVVLALVVLCDLVIYRGNGFAGYSLLFAAAPFLLALGSPLPHRRPSLLLVGAMMLALAMRMVWCGSSAMVVAGFALLLGFAATLAGLCPYVLETAIFSSQALLAGYEGVIHHGRFLGTLGPPISRTRWLSVVLPAIAFLAFGLLFALANPDELAILGKHIADFFRMLSDWLVQFAPTLPEVLLWIVVAWVAIGFLRPVVSRGIVEQMARGRSAKSGASEAAAPSMLYAAFRNMLWTVILLFAVYLVFDFKKLWFQDFPKGFYYSGYAHGGAFWLTVALGLATIVLSVVFRGELLRDPRLSRLRRLAWVWSLENLLLAVAAFHRLYIYIGFNGMTQMRMVGIFGIAAVLVGFVLVVWKILHNRSFLWLVRGQLWTVALTAYLFLLTPVDAIVTHYNVRRIMAGDPAPSVQISVHPIDAEGVLWLTPLINCEDTRIREGVLAMLAQRHADARTMAFQRKEKGWTAYQIADQRVLEQLDRLSSNWSRYTDPGRRREARDRFDRYAYQWY
jgi:hypothetical protein